MNMGARLEGHHAKAAGSGRLVHPVAGGRAGARAEGEGLCERARGAVVCMSAPGARDARLRAG